jgi:hypothetical protein
MLVHMFAWLKMLFSIFAVFCKKMIFYMEIHEKMQFRVTPILPKRASRERVLDKQFFSNMFF